MTYPWTRGERLDAADLDAAFAARLNLTGGTLTGLLTASSGVNVSAGTLTVGAGAVATFNNTPTFGNGALVSTGKTVTFQSTAKLLVNASTGVGTTLVNTGNYFDGTWVMSGAAPAIGVTHTAAFRSILSGSVDTSSLGFNVFPFQVASDNVAVTGANGMNTLAVTHTLGATFTSSRRAIDVSLSPSVANTAMTAGTTAFLTAYRSLTGTNFNLGGTAGTGNTVGSLFGANFNLIANASYLSGISGLEIDLKSTSAATGLANRGGVSVHINPTSAVQGVNHDFAFETSLDGDGTGNSATDAGFRSIFQLGKINGLWPVDPTVGWIINAIPARTATFSDGSVRPHLAAGGFDLWNMSFTTAAYRSTGIVLQDARAKVGPLSIAAISGGASLDATGTVGSVASVATTGASYKVNDQLYDGVGGIIIVNTVNGSGGVTAAAYIAGKAPYYFGAGPATVTPTGGSGNGLAVFNVTWTAAATLSLNPTGGAIAVGGTVTGAAATWTGVLAANLTNFGRGNTYTWSGSTIDTTKFGLYVNNNSAGTSSAAEIPVGAYIVGSSNNIAAPNTLVDQLNVTMNTGGAAAASAGWNAICVNLNDTAATNDKLGSGAGAWVPLQVTRRASFNQGGTGLSPSTAYGQSWGIDVVHNLLSGATNLYLQNGIEIDMSANAGSSVVRRAGLQISSPAAHAVRGTMWDNGIYFGIGAGAATMRAGIAFGQGISGTSPLGSDSKILTYELSQDATAVAAIGIDFNDLTFTTKSIKVPGFDIDPAGVTRIGTAFATATAAGLELDVKGSIGTGTPTINAGGSGFVAGSPIADDAYGGVYVCTIVGTAVSAVTVVRQPTYPTTSPPATLALTMRAPSIGTGAILNGSWSSTAIALAIQPTAGGKLAFNGATPIVKPTGVAVSSAGIHAALVSLGLIAA